MHSQLGRIDVSVTARSLAFLNLNSATMEGRPGSAESFSSLLSQISWDGTQQLPSSASPVATSQNAPKYRRRRLWISRMGVFRFDGPQVDCGIRAKDFIGVLREFTEQPDGAGISELRELSNDENRIPSDGRLFGSHAVKDEFVGWGLVLMGRQSQYLVFGCMCVATWLYYGLSKGDWTEGFSMLFFVLLPVTQVRVCAARLAALKLSTSKRAEVSTCTRKR